MLLPPPNEVSRLVLHRFSPHFTNPSAYGIDDVRPYAVQKAIYRCPDERLTRLCYQLNFTARQDPEFETAREELVAVAGRWMKLHKTGSGRLSIVSGGRPPVVLRYSTPAGLDIEVVTDPVEAMLLDGCAEVASFARIAHLFQTPAEAVSAAAERLEQRGLLLTEEGTALSLPVPTDAAPGASPGERAQHDPEPAHLARER